MSSRKSFFKGMLQKLDVKKLIIAAIISIVILFPTIFATLFVIRSNQADQPSSSDSLTVIIYDSDKSELYKETGSASSYGDESLVAIFNTIRKNLSHIPQIPETADKSKPITVHMIDPSKTDILLIYFSLDKSSSYCLWNNEAYEISSDNSDLFLFSDYSEIMYSNARPPALMTADGDEILPTYADWHYYKNLSEVFINASRVKLSEPSAIYHITGEFNVSFAVVPDACSVDIFNGEELIYSGDLDEATSIKVDSNTPLRVKILAQWSSSDRSFYGSVEYDVSVTIHKRAEFSVIFDSLSSNGFTILKVTNVGNMTKLKFSSEHISPPHFSLFGETAYAVICCPEDFEENNIKFTVSYGASISTFDLPIAINNGIDSDKISTSIEQLGVSFSDITPRFDVPPYLLGMIVTPESYGFVNTLKLGDADGEYYSYRRTYICPDGAGTNVFAVSGGTVSQVGHNEELGRYAVVDVGLGISVIYSNLSITDVFVGDILAAGDVIGKSGHIPRNEDGFSLILWYNGHLFDPALLFINA